MARRKHRLEYLFHPSSIAVVGASTTQGMGGGFLTALQEMRYQGQLYPVNPKVAQLQNSNVAARIEHRKSLPPKWRP